MIKESFLRNYSLSKIYQQAEDEKKKLKVFYIRKVNRIMKQKQQKERQAERLRRSMDNRQTRLRERQIQRQFTRFRHSKQRQNISNEEGITKKLKKDADQVQSSRQKADLRVTQVKFFDNEDENTQILRQTMRLKTNLNNTKRSCKKNTICQQINPIRRTQSNLEVITNSIHHSRNESDLSSSSEGILKSKDAAIFLSHHEHEKQGNQSEKNHQQKMISLTPLKINSNFKRKLKENNTQPKKQASTLGINLHFHKII